MKPNADLERYFWPHVQPPEKLTPAAWADRYRRLPRGQSALSKRYETALSPYTRTLMNLCTVPGLSQLVVVKAAQIGASEAVRCLIGWAAHQQPDPIGIALPVEAKGREIFDTRILSLFNSVEPLRRLMTGRKADAKTARIGLRNGFLLHLMWAGSATSLAADPMRIGILDEVDKFPSWSGSGQGDPVELIRPRLRTYEPRALLIAMSTPSSKFRPVWRLWEECDIKTDFCVPCPRCGFRQRLVLGQLKYEHDPKAKPVDQAERIRLDRCVWYECIQCRAKISESEKPALVEAGKYQPIPGGRPIQDASGQAHECLETVAAFVPGTRVGMHITGLNCLWLSWTRVATDFILSQGSYEKMFAFRTDTLGEPFDEQSTSIHPGIFALKASRAALPAGIVPRWASMLIATVDTQARHVKVIVRAWGRSANDACAESALVWAGAAETDDGRFAPLDELLRRIWPVDGAGTMRIGLLLIDSGGTKLGDAEISRTQQVYRWVADRQLGGIVWAIKGQGDWSPARDAKDQHFYPAETSKHQIVKPWMIDVDFFSDALAWDIERGRDKPEEEIWHLCKDVPAEYCREMSNNIKVLERGTRGVESRWRPISSGACIDYFDCEVYQMAAARMVEARYPFPPRQAVEEARKAEDEAARRVQAPKEERPFGADEEEFRRLREGRRESDAWSPGAEGYKL